MRTAVTAVALVFIFAMALATVYVLLTEGPDVLTLIGLRRRGGAVARGLRRAHGAVAEAPPQELMPYTLFQGGRRRRRRRAPAVLALVALLAAAAAAVLLVVERRDGGRHGERDGAARGRPPAALGPAPLAGGGTAPSPLAVRLEEGGDPVRARFKHMPRAGLLFDIDTGRVLWRHQPTRVLPIASLTKMMTALVVTDRVKRGARVPITREALRYQGSGVGLLPRGKRIRVDTMLTGCCCRRATTRRSRSPSAPRAPCRGSSTR